jgi:hypothetical protein
MAGSDFRLVPRLVPRPLWGWSASRLLKAARWQRIRSDAMAAAGGACAICGVARDKGMIADEEWTYAGGTATLTGIRILCPACNAVTHIGNTSTRGYYDVARDHMALINGITAGDADRLIAAHLAEWQQRSAMTWMVAAAPELLSRYPELSILVGHRAGPGDGMVYR